MPTKLNFSQSFLTILSAFLFMIAPTALIAQDGKAEPNGFTIVVTKTADGLALTSEKGSAWVDLTFTLNDYQPQAIDEYGLTELGAVSQEKDEELADFLFTIFRTPEGIVLEGLEGTDWKGLKFLLGDGERQVFDESGTSGLD